MQRCQKQAVSADVTQASHVRVAIIGPYTVMLASLWVVGSATSRLTALTHLTPTRARAEEQASENFRNKRRKRVQEATGEEEQEDEGEPFNLETYQVPLREWVAQDQTRNEIKRRFVSAAAGAGRGD